MLVKQAANVLDLLEYFAQHKQTATLTEIAQHFGWPRSSTFNLIGTLTARGFLFEPRTRGGYYPTPRWLRLSQELTAVESIPESLQQILREIADLTGETSAIAVPTGAKAVYLEVIESPKAVRYSAQVGKTIPMHATTTGRALLSQYSPRDRAAFLDKVSFKAYTPTTLMSAEDVELEIERSLKRGWFESNAEFTSDLGGVAIPLSVNDRQFALLVAGPMFRIQPRYEEVAAAMRSAIQKRFPELLPARRLAPRAPARSAARKRKA